MAEENKKIDFDGVKTICSMCGSPAVRKRMASGTTYIVSVMQDVLDEYFKNRDDIDDFLRDRLQRAERIITQLRKLADELRKENK